MVALFLGILLVEGYYLYDLLRQVYEQPGGEEIFEYVWLLAGFNLINGLLVVIAYAIGRHFSGQQTKPWWAFFLLGGVIAFATIKINGMLLETPLGVEGETPMTFLLPVILGFLLAWLPLGRVPGGLRQRPFDCPHCGHSHNFSMKSVNKVGDKVLVCEPCQGHMKRTLDGGRLAIWFVPVFVLLFGVSMNFPLSVPLAPWLMLFVGLLYLISLRLQPVESVPADESEQESPVE
ncbi:hypothetical protein CWE09_10740 [Aliidiomarina minuta]|uniref:Uncharacterized protein n=1 Tax=Aliidiomarina minuta TaxID=880057 RepID=A0A432W4I5_9GAMM|nr:hypothetical protein [Aliidiomarina minuta]RUO24344.1 hypothetical protein CWE09_10740 [Aliidiomarina minuta]